MRIYLLGGVVSGSVSMTVEKNIRGVDATALHPSVKILPLCIKELPKVTIRLAIMAPRTKSKRWSLRVINNPPKRTNGSIEAVPIHQLADWSKIKAVITTAIAAGLKICFLPMAKTYFEAIAKTDAEEASIKKFKSAKESAGEIIKARIRAVMYVDSGLLGAL